MKLIVSPIIAELGGGQDMVDAFSTVGQVITLDWFKYRKSIAVYEQQLATALKTRPDIFFCQWHGGVIEHRRCVDLKRISPMTKWVTWCGDCRNITPEWSFQYKDIFDLTLYSNMRDVQNLSAKGVNAAYLQIGFDPKKYYRTMDENPAAPQIVFLGNHYQNHPFPLCRERASMVQLLHGLYGDRFGVYGANWKAIGIQATKADATAERVIYNCCQIAINHSHYNVPRYTSDRLFRAMACGAYVISNYYPDIEKEFKIGEHLDVFKSLDELPQLIDAALKTPDRGNAIATAGMEHVYATATWEQRVKQFMGMMKGDTNARPLRYQVV